MLAVKEKSRMTIFGDMLKSLVTSGSLKHDPTFITGDEFEMCFVATKYGILTDSRTGHCTPDLRSNAKMFTSFNEADKAAAEWASPTKASYYAVLRSGYFPKNGLCYISTKYGFVAEQNGHCVLDVRKAQVFTSFAEADYAAAQHAHRGVFSSWAILHTGI